MKRFLLCFATVLLFSTNAFAHGAEEHKGPMVQGTLVSLDGDIAVVQTKERKITVSLFPDTKFEAGKDGKAATKSDLNVGSEVIVHGHKLDTGEFGAKDVIINPATDDGRTSHEKGGDEKCSSE